MCLIAEDVEDVVLGYAWYQWRSQRDTHSGFGICIRPDTQGAGLGRALMQRLLDIAHTTGPETMSLTVQKANERAYKLYASMGFSVVREQLRGGDGEPEYYMERCTRSDPCE